ncbi:hypothetical protein MJO29_001695, partial [Puccinia striiformis f. sp. tritici]
SFLSDSLIVTMSFPIIHSTGSASDHGSMIVPQVAAAARDAGQPPETLALPPAIDRTTNLSIGRNVNVTGTNARTTTEASDTVMVDIGNLSIRQDDQAHNVGALEDIVPTPNRNARVSFVEALEEELPPAYEESEPACPRRLPYVSNTLPPAHHTRWIGRPTRASSTARVRAQAANLRRSLPEFARSNMSRPDSSPSPPSSPVPPIPATPRMRPARPPIMDGRTSAALTVTMFFRCLRSIRLTLRTFPANHSYAAQHQQLRNKTDLMELWFHNHHEHLQEELNNPQSPARLVYHTLFPCAGHLIQLTNLPPTYNPLDPTM